MSRNRVSYRQQSSVSSQSGVAGLRGPFFVMAYMAAIRLAVPLLSVNEPQLAGADTIVVLGGRRAVPGREDGPDLAEGADQARADQRRR